MASAVKVRVVTDEQHVARAEAFLALHRPGEIPELAQLGVGRVSTGGGLAFAALGAALEAARELGDHGTAGYAAQSAAGAAAARAAFGQPG